MNIKLMPVLLLLTAPAVADNAFDAYKKQQQQAATNYSTTTKQDFEQYKKALDAGFKDLQQTYLQESKRYRAQVTKQWGSFKESDKTTWVNYASNGRVRESVNFETGTVEVEFLAYKTDSAANLKQQAQQSVVNLLTTTEQQAFANDVVAQKVETKIKQHSDVVKTGKPSANTLVMAPLVAKVELTNKPAVTQLANTLVSSATTETKPINAKQQIVKVSFKIPKKLSAKASKYSARVQQIAKKEKIPEALVYAVIETESNFNPLAKSHIPAYGLMQIVPVSAGKDATKYLFGKTKVLAPSYLYNSNNNIAVGGAYLHILYYSYLRKIEDSTSRLFCTIAAYNTGAGNVAKSFIGSYNINKAITKINKMSASEVYRHLRKHLPHDETKHYIKRVATRMAKYQP
ncbi:MAG: membrane-bound lytic murein transglycosylase C [Methyloprofundus sp.]|nr:MAG: membrane-bound lytic murein transglycosylase C [Methyloprofundus sp.]